MMRFSYFMFFIFAFSIGLWACTNQKKDKFVNLNSAQFQELLDTAKNVQLIDVRTPAEYSQSSIADSKNIDVYDPEFAAKVEALNPAYPVAVYCKSGRRSRNAANILAEKGFKVYNLDKGITGWIDDGMPVDDTK